MSVSSLVNRAVNRVRMSLKSNFRTTGSLDFFDAQDIPHLLNIWKRTGGASGSNWDRYRHAHMRLPSWFRRNLDPWGFDYHAQQHMLWHLITGIGEPYSPSTHEREFGWEGVDPIRRPGFYHRRDQHAVTFAADHILATGMLMKHCRLKPGDRAIEYGAGFGQSALALARLGVQVDTVDISASFCEFIQRQADFFRVPLTPYCEAFGFNPRPNDLYHLIWFFESFHHCENFISVVPRLKDMLAVDGQLILSGEPIVEDQYAAVPYPWGVRLHSEVVVIMHATGWFELGFTESFIYELFSRSGLVGRRVDCPDSSLARLFIFERRH
jgi:SAM-dependent methyltransferase